MKKMLADELKALIKGEVYTDEQTLKKFSRDTSIFEVRPEVVVCPKDAADLGALVRFASDKKQMYPNISLTARSGGTDMGGGPLNDSIIVDMTKYFNRILDLSDSFAVVEPGVYFRNFDRETSRKDLFFPAYPASREICTIGGMVANNSGGEKTLAYGKTEKYVRELKVVLADGNQYEIKPLSEAELSVKAKLSSFEGEVYRKTRDLLEKNKEAIERARPKVSKNSAGYFLWNIWRKNEETGEKVFDLTRLFVGSQGTLGIITEAKLGLEKKKKVEKLAIVFLKDTSRLAELVVEALKHKPQSLESYDDHTFKLAVKFFPAIVRLMKPKSFFKMAAQFLPELATLIFKGMPKMVVMAEFAGDSDSEVDKKLSDFSAAMVKLGFLAKEAKTEAEVQKYWTIRRESFNLLRQKIKKLSTAPFIDDIIVRPEFLPEFLPKLESILKEYPGLLYTVAGHAGDGNLHIIPLMNLQEPGDRAMIPKISEKVYALVLEYKGSITAEHNDGLIRTPYLEKMYGQQMVSVFSELKNIFDPKGIFNPRKKVGGTMEYSLSHIKH